MISHPVYVRHSIHYIYDIVPTKYEITNLYVDYTTLGICMTSFALQKPTHPLYLNKPQSLWLHIHFRREITPPVSDIATTVSLLSHPLHWYHTLFIWHHTHYICDIICTIYNIISTSYVIPLFYLWQRKLHIWNHIQYEVQTILYPSEITATSLFHHSHSIESITLTLWMTSHLA